MPKADVGPYKKITKKEFSKIQLLAGVIVQVKPHPKLKTHYVMTIGTPAQDEDYQVVAELAGAYTMPQLLGKQVLIVGNITPENVGGIESQGMILAAYVNKKPALVTTDKKVPPGATVQGLLNGKVGYK